MKALYVLICIAVIVISSGCEGSRYPIASSDLAPVDTNLIGLWRLQSPADQDAQEMTIRQFNDHEYYLEYISESAELEQLIELDTLRFRAYTTPVGGALFANIVSIDTAPAERTFLFFRYSMPDKNTLDAQMVRESTYKTIFSGFNSSKEVFEYIRDNVADDSLYDTEIARFVKENSSSRSPLRGIFD